MGNQPSTPIEYAVPIENADRKANETFIYRNPDGLDLDLNNFDTKLKTIHDIYKKMFNDGLNEDCIGYRAKNPDGSLQNSYTWYKKQQVKQMAEELGSGFVRLNLYNINREWKGRNMKLVAVYSKNNPEYMIMDIAMTMQGITTVPIYDTLGEEAIEFIFDQTKITSCFITANLVPKLVSEQLNNKRFKYLKNLIIMDYDNYDKQNEPSDKSVFNIIPYQALIEEGKKGVLPWAEVDGETEYCISYTSGTTGIPKGAILNHKNLLAGYEGVTKRVHITAKDIHISYLPLAHIFERGVFKLCLSENAKIGLYNGDVLKIKEDLAILKPTIFVSVPRLYNKFYDAIMASIAQSTGLKRKLVDKAIETKLSNLKEKGQHTHFLFDILVFNKIKAVLGGRVRLMITASAPINSEVVDFLKVAFSCPMIEGYGQTECAGGEFTTCVEDPLSGHVGGPLIHNEFKLVDVEDMNYTSSDVDEKGRAKPRGEIWIRGPNIFPGYFLNPKENEEIFSKDGWLKSGDIGQLTPDGNRLQIIDRKKNIFKLSQGEYIAPEKLEGVYKVVHPLIGDVFVYGDSLKSCLVGIVNIEKKDIKRLATELGVEGTEDSLPESEQLKAALIKLFNEEAAKRKFNKLEQLKRIAIETRLFNDLGILTTTFKKKRDSFKNHYKSTLDGLYTGLE